MNYVCQHMQAPTDFHFLQVKRILRYVKAGTLDLGQFIIVATDFTLSAYSDADWQGVLLLEDP